LCAHQYINDLANISENGSVIVRVVSAVARRGLHERAIIEKRQGQSGIGFRRYICSKAILLRGRQRGVTAASQEQSAEEADRQAACTAAVQDGFGARDRLEPTPAKVPRRS
jgi:hypothetical protein